MRFFKGISALDYSGNESAPLQKEGGTIGIIRRIEPIPGKLLPSRACFRLAQRSNVLNQILYLQPVEKDGHILYKETWSIGLYKWEKQADQDKMLRELWDENQILKKQVKKYKGKFTKVGWAVIAILFKLLEENKGHKQIKKRFDLMNVDSVLIEGKTMSITFKRELNQLPQDEITKLPNLD